MTTRAGASAGNGRGSVRARGVGSARPLSRGGADEQAPPPGGWPRFPAGMLNGLAAGTDAISGALNRASHGLERPHHG